MHQERHPCPCCGHRTYLEPAGRTMQICPVCFWEDLDENLHRRADRPGLYQAQISFGLHGVSRPCFADLVRDPLPEESRSPAWMCIPEFKSKVLSLVREAFANVLLEDGISLHQARALDDHADQPQLERARLLDPELHWQDISRDKINAFHQSLVFFDPKGFRYHLPAFMVFALEGFDPESGIIEACGILSANNSSICYLPANSDLLDRAQREALASFLKFVSLYAGGGSREDAASSFAIGMNSWLPDFLKENTF